MNEEVERGYRDARAEPTQADDVTVSVRCAELNKLCVLLENFLEMNSGDFIILGRKQGKRTVISNWEDVEYVFGYLKGLT